MRFGGKKMDNIVETLRYVDLKFKEIQEILIKDIKKEEKCEFLKNRTADILSNLNKCYDYCVFILSQKVDFSALNEKERKKIEKSYKYFPFSKKKLEEPFYQGIKIVKPDIFNYLSNLVDKITSNTPVETNASNTYNDLRYGMAKEIHDLCNEDKHHQLLEITAVSNAKAHIEMENGMTFQIALVNCKGDLSGMCAPINFKRNGYLGNVYKVVGCSQELEMFLNNRIKITKQIVKEFGALLDTTVRL